MRAILISAAFILTACAAPQQRQITAADFAGVSTLEGFFLREATLQSSARGSGFAQASRPLQECIIRGGIELAPPAVIDAAENFLAVRTDAAYSQYLSASEAAFDADPGIEEAARRMGEECKAKHGA